MLPVILRRSVLASTVAAAIALTGFDLQPAAAGAPQSGPAIVKSMAQDLSAARKKRHGRGNGFPVAAFGAIAGTIAGIAAAERRRDYYERPYGYYAPGYVYEAPVAAPYGYAPQPYSDHHYGYHGGYRHGGAGAAAPTVGMDMNPSPGH
jgi:hypothetical protein